MYIESKIDSYIIDRHEQGGSAKKPHSLAKRVPSPHQPSEAQLQIFRVF